MTVGTPEEGETVEKSVGGWRCWGSSSSCEGGRKSSSSSEGRRGAFKSEGGRANTPGHGEKTSKGEKKRKFPGVDHQHRQERDGQAKAYQT